MNIEQIARVCHDANRSYCDSIGDHSQKPWDDAEDWQRRSAIEGVQFALDHPDAPASAHHDAWLADKERNGWKFGPVKDSSKKEHPSVVPYSELPLEQRVKDYLFRAVVQAFVEAER
jgi:RyR domain